MRDGVETKENTMPRLQAIDPKTATGRAKDLLGIVQSRYGMVSNLTRTVANSPAALETYLGFSALDQGTLSPALREQIALTVAETEVDFPPVPALVTN